MSRKTKTWMARSHTVTTGNTQDPIVPLAAGTNAFAEDTVELFSAVSFGTVTVNGLLAGAVEFEEEVPMIGSGPSNPTPLLQGGADVHRIRSMTYAHTTNNASDILARGGGAGFVRDIIPIGKSKSTTGVFSNAINEEALILSVEAMVSTSANTRGFVRFWERDILVGGSWDFLAEIPLNGSSSTLLSVPMHNYVLGRGREIKVTAETASGSNVYTVLMRYRRRRFP